MSVSVFLAAWKSPLMWKYKELYQFTKAQVARMPGSPSPLCQTHGRSSGQGVAWQAVGLSARWVSANSEVQLCMLPSWWREGTNVPVHPEKEQQHPRGLMSISSEAMNLCVCVCVCMSELGMRVDRDGQVCLCQDGCV